MQRAADRVKHGAVGVWLGLALVGGLAMGCGGATQTPCPTAVSVRDAPAVLDGAWRVYRWDGAFDGTLVFAADRVQAASTGTTYSGRWSVTTAAPGRLAMEMRMDEATVDGVRQVYATPSLVALAVVFSSADEVIALQDDGAWTRWERILATLAPGDTVADPGTEPAEVEAPTDAPQDDEAAP